MKWFFIKKKWSLDDYFGVTKVSGVSARFFDYKNNPSLYKALTNLLMVLWLEGKTIKEITIEDEK